MWRFLRWYFVKVAPVLFVAILGMVPVMGLLAALFGGGDQQGLITTLSESAMGVLTMGVILAGGVAVYVRGIRASVRQFGPGWGLGLGVGIVVGGVAFATVGERVGGLVFSLTWIAVAAAVSLSGWQILVHGPVELGRSIRAYLGR